MPHSKNEPITTQLIIQFFILFENDIVRIKTKNLKESSHMAAVSIN